ncbi:N-acetylglucosaminyl deacetylase, LmbE family [Candidatus Methanophagaceae archaeon]|nr:N-acetylglucosaminyl deacetylase, LmbE family [Methanophagales archaeon]
MNVKMKKLLPVLSQNKEYMPITNKSPILIFAPHRDDEVIGAGGKIIQTMERGGKVFIVYMTNGTKKKELTLIYEAEAKSALHVANVAEQNLIFLRYELGSLINPKIAKDAIAKIEDLIKIIKPKEIFVPAYEGGNKDHDMTNHIVFRALKKIKNPRIDFYEFPEYNNHISFKNLPKKIFKKITKHTPFKYTFAPEFILIKGYPTLHLKMTERERKLKKEMLRQYTTSNSNDALVKSFCFPDRFRKYPYYNYLKPPTHRMYYDDSDQISFNDFKRTIIKLNNDK